MRSAGTRGSTLPASLLARFHRGAHRGEVDDRGHPCEVLHQNPGRAGNGQLPRNLPGPPAMRPEPPRFPRWWRRTREPHQGLRSAPSPSSAAPTGHEGLTSQGHLVDKSEPSAAEGGPTDHLLIVLARASRIACAIRRAPSARSISSKRLRQCKPPVRPLRRGARHIGPLFDAQCILQRCENDSRPRVRQFLIRGDGDLDRRRCVGEAVVSVSGVAKWCWRSSGSLKFQMPATVGRSCVPIAATDSRGHSGGGCILEPEQAIRQHAARTQLAAHHGFHQARSSRR